MNATEKQTIECQIFDWEEWDGDIECMIFYNPVLKVQVGKHPLAPSLIVPQLCLIRAFFNFRSVVLNKRMGRASGVNSSISLNISSS